MLPMLQAITWFMVLMWCVLLRVDNSTCGTTRHSAPMYGGDAGSVCFNVLTSHAGCGQAGKAKETKESKETIRPLFGFMFGFVSRPSPLSVGTTPRPRSGTCPAHKVAGWRFKFSTAWQWGASLADVTPTVPR